MLKAGLKECVDCNGVGSHDPEYHGCGGVKCRTCNGEGDVYAISGSPISETVPCNTCKGEKYVRVPCSPCGAKGYVRVPLTEKYSTEFLIRELENLGSTGLDMSPGDPVMAAAAARLRELSK